MVDPPELTIALLRWVQAFQTSRTVNAWDDLRDGHVLWEILHDIDPDYFTESLPESRADAADNWIPRWQNLKHINRLVIAYVRDMCGTLEEPSRNMTPDLKAIATDASPQDTVMVQLSVESFINRIGTNDRVASQGYSPYGDVFTCLEPKDGPDISRPGTGSR